MRLSYVTVRDTVRKLGSFSTNELATELDVTVQASARWLARLQEDGLVEKGRRVLGQPSWNYVKPTEAGDAFANQQRHLRSLPAPEDVAGSYDHNDPKLSRVSDQIANKEVRDAVREAEAAGWVLSRTGTDHFVLRKDGLKLHVSGTPRSATTMAKYIRQNRRNAEAGRGRHAV